MKNNVRIIIVVVVTLILVSMGLLITKNINDEKEKYTTNASAEEINKINTIMNENYYRYLGDSFNGAFEDYIGNALQILYSNSNDDIIALDQEKYDIGVDFANRVYKYSKEELDKELKDKYNSELLYNYLSTSTTGDILVFDGENVYYSLPKDEYAFIVKNINTDGNKTVITLYEYLINKDNKEIINNSLKKGEIPPKEIKINNIYEFVFEENNDELKLVSKVTK